VADKGQDDGLHNDDQRDRPGFGNVYIAYFSGKTPFATTGRNPAFARAGDIFVSTSTTNGTTWGPRVKVNDDNTPTSHVFPTAAINKRGELFVGWLGRRVDPARNLLTDTWGDISARSGHNFGRDIRITNVSTDVAGSFVFAIISGLVAHQVARRAFRRTQVPADSGRNKDITVAVKAQTKISGNPQVNDGVEVTASIDAAGNYTAISIFKLGIVPPPLQVHLSGVVKSMSTSLSFPPITTWTIGPSAGLGPDFMVQVNAQTEISGDPKVGDRVDVIAESSSTGAYVAISITKV
jgi:hypothetical protein